jgi:uncharacterized membrane protein
MKQEFPITSNVAQKVWDNFERDLLHRLKSLPEPDRTEISLEILSHLFYSAQNDPALSEEERYLNAIERLGSPDKYLKPLVDDILLYNSLDKGNPVAVVGSLQKLASRGLLHILGTFILGFGYFTVIMLFIMAVLHMVDPGVGVWTHQDGNISFSFSAQPDSVQWIPAYFTPVGIAISCAGYWFLNRVLRMFVSLNRADKKS